LFVFGIADTEVLLLGEKNYTTRLKVITSFKIVGDEPKRDVLNNEAHFNFNQQFAVLHEMLGGGIENCMVFSLLSINGTWQ
jgi:hypothetical protein